MHLVQILLPLTDSNGKQFSQQMFAEVRAHLLKTFGGVTIYSRSVATGLWKDPDGEIEKDEMVIFEVMTKSVEAVWWSDYRKELEKKFEQDEIVIRATEFEKL